MADHLTYAEITQEVQRLVKQFKGGKEDVVHAAINMSYLELLNCDNRYALHWLVNRLDNGVASAPVEITNITTVAPPVVTAAGHTLENGDIVGIYDVEGMTEVNDRLFIVSASGVGTFSLTDYNTGESIDATGYTPYTSGGYAVHRGKTLSGYVRRVLAAGFKDHIPMDPITEMAAENTSSLHDLSNYTRPYFYTHIRRVISSGEVNRLLWYPACDDAYTSRIFTEDRPSRMENDADVPNLLPQFHYGIIAGALARLAEYDVQVENAVVWPKIYEWHILNLRAYNRRWWKKHQEGGEETPFMI